MEMFNLQGKKAIVTGGNKGLGLKITEALLEQGAAVAILASSESTLEVADSFTAAGFRAYGVRCDLGDGDSIEQSFRSAVSLLGGIDILVNNAGVQKRHPCEDFPFKDWQTVIDINLNAVFILSQLAGREMLEQHFGRIINIASMLSFFGGITVPAYAASKGAVAQLTKALSNEWSSKGITVNAIAPGYMDTEMNERLIADEVRNAEITSRIPMHRWGTPDDMKGIVVFLASNASSYITGAIIPVDGGYLAR